jgi:uncharacterized protein
MNYTLITGASSGIGLELSKIFAKNNHNLVLIARTKKVLETLKKDFEKKYNVKVIVIAEDLTDLKSSVRIKNKLKNIKINILVNNAGFGDFGVFEKTNYETNESMINLNITTLTNLTRLFLDDLIETKGKIMNVASVAAFQPGPYMSVYFATKAYVLSFSEALSEELKGKVTVSCLCPGPTRTNFDKVANAKNLFKGKLPTAKDVAVYGYNSLMKGKVVAVHSLKFKLITQLNRITPRSIIRKIAGKINKG